MAATVLRSGSGCAPALANYIDNYHGSRQAQYWQVFGSRLLQLSAELSGLSTFRTAGSFRPNLTLTYGLRYEFQGTLSIPAVSHRSIPGLAGSISAGNQRVVQAARQEQFRPPGMALLIRPVSGRTSVRSRIRPSFAAASAPFYDILYSNIGDNIAAEGPRHARAEHLSPQTPAAEALERLQLATTVPPTLNPLLHAVYGGYVEPGQSAYLSSGISMWNVLSRLIFCSRSHMSVPGESACI